jgi:endonuclease III
VNDQIASDALRSLLERLDGQACSFDVPECGIEPLLYEFLRSFMIWESSLTLAEARMARLLNGVVDCNEIRIFLPQELSEILGTDDPFSMERAMRMGSALNDLYEREHDVTVERLGEMNKREARSYLLSLEGVPPFVASRMLLLGLGGHAFPVDQRLVKLLAGEGVLSKNDTVESATNRLERVIRSGDAAQAYLAIEAWADRQPLPRPKRVKKKSGARAKTSTKGQD